MINKKFILLILLLIPYLTFSQCAMCRAVVEQGGEEMAAGINYGIIYLMSFPYLVIGAAIYFLYRSWKKNK